jgi:hypothetical protein
VKKGMPGPAPHASLCCSHGSAAAARYHVHTHCAFARSGAAPLAAPPRLLCLLYLLSGTSVSFERTTVVILAARPAAWVQSSRTLRRRQRRGGREEGCVATGTQVCHARVGVAPQCRTSASVSRPMAHLWRCASFISCSMAYFWCVPSVLHMAHF